MKNSYSILAAFVGGALVGSALALLFAPESGKETRKKITDFLDKNGLKLEDSDNEAEDLIVNNESTSKTV